MPRVRRAYYPPAKLLRQGGGRNSQDGRIYEMRNAWINDKNQFANRPGFRRVDTVASAEGATTSLLTANAAFCHEYSSDIDQQYYYVHGRTNGQTYIGGTALTSVSTPGNITTVEMGFETVKRLYLISKSQSLQVIDVENATIGDAFTTTIGSIAPVITDMNGNTISSITGEFMVVHQNRLFIFNAYVTTSAGSSSRVDVVASDAGNLTNAAAFGYGNQWGNIAYDFQALDGKPTGAVSTNTGLVIFTETSSYILIGSFGQGHQVIRGGLPGCRAWRSIEKGHGDRFYYLAREGIIKVNDASGGNWINISHPHPASGLSGIHEDFEHVIKEAIVIQSADFSWWGGREILACSFQAREGIYNTSLNLTLAYDERKATWYTWDLPVGASASAHDGLLFLSDSILYLRPDADVIITDPSGTIEDGVRLPTYNNGVSSVPTAIAPRLWLMDGSDHNDMLHIWRNGGLSSNDPWPPWDIDSTTGVVKTSWTAASRQNIFKVARPIYAGGAEGLNSTTGQVDKYFLHFLSADADPAYPDSWLTGTAITGQVSGATAEYSGVASAAGTGRYFGIKTVVGNFIPGERVEDGSSNGMTITHFANPLNRIFLDDTNTDNAEIANNGPVFTGMPCLLTSEFKTQHRVIWGGNISYPSYPASSREATYIDIEPPLDTIPYAYDADHPVYIVTATPLCKIGFEATMGAPDIPKHLQKIRAMVDGGDGLLCIHVHKSEGKRSTRDGKLSSTDPSNLWFFKQTGIPVLAGADEGFTAVATNAADEYDDEGFRRYSGGSRIVAETFRIEVTIFPRGMEKALQGIECFIIPKQGRLR